MTDWVSWWESLDWGNVPSWFAAVGTVGALFLTLGILLSDRRKNRRALADAVITTYQLSHRPGRRPKNEPAYNFSLHVLNASTQPILHAALYGHDPDEPGDPIAESLIHYAENPDKPRVIMPGDSAWLPLGFADKPDLMSFVLEFADARGVLWYRNIRTDKYMSRRAFHRERRPELIRF